MSESLADVKFVASGFRSPVLTIPAQPHGEVLTLWAPDGTRLVTIYADGTLGLGDTYTPDGAAQRFWEAIMLCMPKALKVTT